MEYFVCNKNIIMNISISHKNTLKWMNYTWKYCPRLSRDDFRDKRYKLSIRNIDLDMREELGGGLINFFVLFSL